MKFLIAFQILVIVYVIAMLSCSHKQVTVAPKLIIDTTQKHKNDSLQKVIDSILAIPAVVLHDTVPIVEVKQGDSLLQVKLFIANYKLERVKYYLNICYRNPTQDKFLKGWINRAIQ